MYACCPRGGVEGEEAEGRRGKRTSLRLSLWMGTRRMLPRRPRASVHSSSTNTPTSCDKLPVFSLSSSSSCKLARCVIYYRDTACSHLKRKIQKHFNPNNVGPAGGGRSPGGGLVGGCWSWAAARRPAGSPAGPRTPPQRPRTPTGRPARPSPPPPARTDTRSRFSASTR